jgi:hypothetical protein
MTHFSRASTRMVNDWLHRPAAAGGVGRPRVEEKPRQIEFSTGARWLPRRTHYSAASSVSATRSHRAVTVHTQLDHKRGVAGGGLGGGQG